MRLKIFASTDGGVGISSLTALRAVGFLHDGESVRLIDLDPQRTLTNRRSR